MDSTFNLFHPDSFLHSFIPCFISIYLYGNICHVFSFPLSFLSSFQYILSSSSFLLSSVSDSYIYTKIFSNKNILFGSCLHFLASSSSFLPLFIYFLLFFLPHITPSLFILSLKGHVMFSVSKNLYHTHAELLSNHMH